VTAKTVKETMDSCFQTRNLSVPTAWKAVNFVQNVMKFLKALGTKGFQEAERLQGFRSAAIFDILKQSRSIDTTDLVLPLSFFHYSDLWQTHRSVGAHRSVGSHRSVCLP
jgi:hypothetical protein